MAYVGGSPFQATDPSGMIAVAKSCEGGFVVEYIRWDDGKVTKQWTNETCSGGSTVGVTARGGNVTYRDGPGDQGYSNNLLAPLSYREISNQYLQLYRAWQHNLSNIDPRMKNLGIFSNIMKYTFRQNSYPDCIDFAESCADWLNQHNPFPGVTQAFAVPSNPGNIWHYNVSIQMYGAGGIMVEIDRFDPWYSNWFH